MIPGVNPLKSPLMPNEGESKRVIDSEVHSVLLTSFTMKHIFETNELSFLFTIPCREWALMVR